MCVGMPCQIVEIVDEASYVARVEVSGVKRDVNIVLVRDDGVKVGDWVLVHAGLAMRRIDQDEALETVRFLEMLASAS